MSAARQAFGELGERIAERWLRRQGWRVVQRRFRNGHRDIDLVVEREGWSRSSRSRRGAATEFGGSGRSGQLAEAEGVRPLGARSGSIGTAGPTDAYRFDVVGVLVEGNRVRVRHVENAFPLHLSA